ncbi:DUF1203 domain-containing protein [Ruegeria atlantica]|uniref:DUF1203 domain-containing protein n=1 Tax=Ruegeria atlantica TaxID=81569 RepID=UPI00147FD22E|nr:DUF1203 domain-containing protein [Ruegeria atlantica]
MRYSYQPIPTEVVDWHRREKVDWQGNEILFMNDGGTYPCRHCLKESGSSSGALLFSYQPILPKGVYAQPTAVFICNDDCKKPDEESEVPEIVYNRFVALRTFRENGMMDYGVNTLCDGSDVAKAMDSIFENDEVAFVNIHTALAGCLLCTVRRT